MILLLLAGCSRLKSGSAAGSSEHSCSIKLTLENPEQATPIRPGQALVALVEIANTGQAPLTLPELDGGSVEFWVGRPEDTRRNHVPPVISERERASGLGTRMTTLGPGATISRRFVHTLLTRESGEFTLQAHYPMTAGAEAKDAVYYSEPVGFQVSGARLFTRDTDGIILKSDAMAVAERALDGAPGSSEAILIRDEKGFLKWWVNTRAPDEHAPKAALVDPYLGRVWAMAEPFSPKAPPANSIPDHPEPIQQQGD